MFIAWFGLLPANTPTKETDAELLLPYTYRLPLPPTPLFPPTKDALVPTLGAPT